MILYIRSGDGCEILYNSGTHSEDYPTPTTSEPKPKNTQKGRKEATPPEWPLDGSYGRDLGWIGIREAKVGLRDVVSVGPAGTLGAIVGRSWSPNTTCSSS